MENVESLYLSPDGFFADLPAEDGDGQQLMRVLNELRRNLLPPVTKREDTEASRNGVVSQAVSSPNVTHQKRSPAVPVKSAAAVPRVPIAPKPVARIRVGPPTNVPVTRFRPNTTTPTNGVRPAPSWSRQTSTPRSGARIVTPSPVLTSTNTTPSKLPSYMRPTKSTLNKQRNKQS